LEIEENIVVNKAIKIFMLNELKQQIDKAKLPRHMAIIMDGNGRWAKQRGLPRTEGHKNAVQSVREVIEAAAEIGIEYLTLYTFSTENWNRPQEEVHALMDLLVRCIEAETPTMQKNNIRFTAIGDLARMPLEVKNRLDGCIETTSKNTGLTLVLALSYSSRWEIVEAVKTIATKVKAEELAIEDITESVISQSLTTKEIPDPDLIVRTSGELRISNFLLWQVAYSEFFFTDIHWPDFRKVHFFEAILDYQRRERRFGKTGEQIK
jgi:undecaprenyl diphosphate synthase